MEVGGFANAFGNGLAFPFLFIYLHNVRGFALADGRPDRRDERGRWDRLDPDGGDDRRPDRRASRR